MLASLKSGLASLVARLTLAANDSSADDSQIPLRMPAPGTLKLIAARRRWFGLFAKAVLIGLGILIAASPEYVGGLIGANANPTDAIAYFMVVCIGFFILMRAAFYLYWSQLLERSAKSNDSYDRVRALLSVAQTYASFQDYATICLFVGALGIMFLWNLGIEQAFGSVDGLIITFLTIILAALAYSFHAPRLGRILIGHALFIAVQAEAAPISNQEVHEDVATRLLPRFQKEYPEHFS